MSFRLSVLVGVIILICSTSLLAQLANESTARLPRPKVAHDAQYDLGLGGYPVRIFFEEGKSFADPTGHVFYEPLIYLQTDNEGKLKNSIDDNGLLLFFRVETDGDFLVDTIRDNLNKTAQERAEEEIVPGSLKYRISPLTMSEAWFESGISRHRSISFENKALVERGELLIFFEIPKQEAEKLLNNLQDGLDQLLFKYSFSGVSDEVCEADFKGETTRALESFRRVGGPGRKGFVTRHQVAKIVEDMIVSESLSVRCGSSEWLVYLADQLLDMLSTRSLKLEDAWATLYKITEFDPKSFTADVVRKTKDIERKASRDIIDESVADAVSKSKAWTAEAGGSGYGFGASASYGEATSETRAMAKKDFRDVMAKMGILGEWEGEQYIPKSVDVHSVADLEGSWGRDVEVRYVITTGQTGQHSVSLTKESFSSAVKEPNLPSRVLQIEKNLEELQRHWFISLQEVIPIGGITMFSGNPDDLPGNWRICDGQMVNNEDSPFNGERLPDLRGLFVRGAETQQMVSVLGGSDERATHNHTFSASLNIPRKSLKDEHLSTRIVGSWSVVGDIDYDRRDNAIAVRRNDKGNIKDSHGHTGTVRGDTTKDRQADLDNRPRHVNLHYIIRIK